ncbi:MAG: type I-E CRISPR-associated endoribonuclease Cas2e [bacterium]
MTATMVVTRDVPDRYRGFLASCMLEIAPGVYVSPRMTPAVRDRVWDVCQEWSGSLGQGGVVMSWVEKDLPGGLGVRTLGSPPRELCEVDGVLVARTRAPEAGPATSAEAPASPSATGPGESP